MKFFKQPKYRENQYLATFAINGTTQELNSISQDLNDYFTELRNKNTPVTLTCNEYRQNLEVTITASDKEHIQFWKNYFIKKIR